MYDAKFQALSDPLRLKIIDLLREEELCVCELCDVLHVPQSKLSFHLKILKEAELLTSRQQGRWVYYSLNLCQFRLLERFLNQYCTSTIQPARLCAEDL
ncbi:helix-turn-helix transcriptional regulator [Gloeocapsa sp. PCC 73106]|uniref:ArsR/SmtB family transcription factor n=1 Tax=Gloeocapsa sp. PCC 73106 TaxID=102232 RepID=UPI0002ABF603|nr:metalloregulator ArsR/SmtB family transcription factor [Gloeocapsa sp. PCC 73106]ELR98983.1 putative transcriptional regulator [Gloeocapsa sp. PCC 73106]